MTITRTRKTIKKVGVSDGQRISFLGGDLRFLCVVRGATMATIDEISFLPRWTKRVRTDGGGRDPLGLFRVTEN